MAAEWSDLATLLFSTHPRVVTGGPCVWWRQALQQPAVRFFASVAASLGQSDFFPCQRVLEEAKRHDMAARPSRQSAASTGKRRQESSEENTPAKAARKQFEEGQTTLEQAEPYRILTARMPLDALTADWSLARNRPLQAKHVDALYTIFERGDMKRASYPLAVLSTHSEVQCMLREMGYDDEDTSG